MLDITRDRPVKVAVKVAVPVRDHPKVNTNAEKLRVYKTDKLLVTYFLSVNSLSVQFRWQTIGPQRQFDEASTGGDNV